MDEPMPSSHRAACTACRWERLRAQRPIRSRDVQIPAEVAVLHFDMPAARDNDAQGRASKRHRLGNAPQSRRPCHCLGSGCSKKQEVKSISGLGI